MPTPKDTYYAKRLEDLAEALRGNHFKAHVVPDLAAALALREALSGKACCVTPGGDVVSRQSLTLFAPDAAEHGLLERQREIEELGVLIERREERVDQEHARMAEIEARMDDARNALQEARKHLDDLQEQAHAIQVETLKLAQALERFRERQGQIDANLAEMTGLGMPVPQGFTITTEACTRYYEDGKTIYPDIQEA